VTTAHFATVADVLHAASDASDAPSPGDAPYWLVQSTYRGSECSGSGTTTTCSPVDGHRSYWDGVTGPGVLEDSESTQGKPISMPKDTLTIDGQTLTWPQVNARTWTDQQLLGLVAGGGSSAWYLFKDIGDLLAESPASPTIRSQLWQALEKVPGVRFDGQATDSLGRSGWKISVDDPSQGTASYIIDTDTGTILQSGVTQAWGDRPGTAPQGFGASTYATYTSDGPASTAPQPAGQ